VIGKAIEGGDPDKKVITDIAGGAFTGKCPLWTYILAEAMLNQEPVKLPVTENSTIQTPRLGSVIRRCPASAPAFWVGKRRCSSGSSASTR
jgi:hypothetical protein